MLGSWVRMLAVILVSDLFPAFFSSYTVGDLHTPQTMKRYRFGTTNTGAHHSHNTHNSNGRVKSCHVHAAGESTVVALIRPGHFFRVVKVADGLRRVGIQVDQLVTCSQLLMTFCFWKSHSILPRTIPYRPRGFFLTAKRHHNLDKHSGPVGYCGWLTQIKPSHVQSTQWLDLPQWRGCDGVW